MKHKINFFIIMCISILLGNSSIALAEDTGFLEACLDNVQCAGLYIDSLSNEEAKNDAVMLLPILFRYNPEEHKLGRTEIDESIETVFRRQFANSDNLWERYFQEQLNIRVEPLDNPRHGQT